jgi:peroxiredoxin Q/BCP
MYTIKLVAVVTALAGLLAPAGCQTTPSSLAMETAAASRSEFAGLPAPDFTLKNQNDQPVTLSRQRGEWVVLYFYPKDDTPGCACQATEFTELLTQFRNMNALVFGVSSDSPQSHRLFVEKYALGLTLLSDPDHAVMKRYGAWVETSLGEKKSERVIRSTFIIGPDGLVRYHFPEVIPQGHAERVREKLAELQRGR